MPGKTVALLEDLDEQRAEFGGVEGVSGSTALSASTADRSSPIPAPCRFIERMFVICVADGSSSLHVLCRAGTQTRTVPAPGPAHRA